MLLPPPAGFLRRQNPRHHRRRSLVLAVSKSGNGGRVGPHRARRRKRRHVGRRRRVPHRPRGQGSQRRQFEFQLPLQVLPPAEPGEAGVQGRGSGVRGGVAKGVAWQGVARRAPVPPPTRPRPRPPTSPSTPTHFPAPSTTPLPHPAHRPSHPTPARPPAVRRHPLAAVLFCPRRSVRQVRVGRWRGRLGGLGGQCLAGRGGVGWVLAWRRWRHAGRRAGWLPRGWGPVRRTTNWRRLQSPHPTPFHSTP